MSSKFLGTDPSKISPTMRKLIELAKSRPGRCIYPLPFRKGTMLAMGGNNAVRALKARGIVDKDGYLKGEEDGGA